MVTETFNSSNARPEETCRVVAFCTAPTSDIFLKPNLEFIRTHTSVRETEELIEMAQRKADNLKFHAVKITSRQSAIAVLAGIQ